MKTSNKADGRPAFQWYPDDWLSEPGLRLCDLAARGLWIDLLCHMFRMSERGMLRLNGRALTKQDIGNLVGRPEAEVEAALKQLVSNGVAETDDDGTVYSRRMVRDENERRTKSEAGAKGGKASGRSRREAKGGSPTPTPTPTPTPSSPPFPNPSPLGHEDGASAPPAQPAPRKLRETFARPTLEEVRAYILERKCHVDAESWMAHYESNGWMVGRTHMRDWRAAVRTWEKNGMTPAGGNGRDSRSAAEQARSPTQASLLAQIPDFVREANEINEHNRKLDERKRLERLAAAK